jgi:hypothetical protein
MTDEETPLASIERNPWLLSAMVFISALLIFWVWMLLKDVNPFGFIVMIPAAIFSFQSLWLLLHPFARIYTDKVEIRQSFFHHVTRYFVDMKESRQSKNGIMFITYNDDEIEKMNLFGIRESQRSFLNEQFQEQIGKSLVDRG